jgi:hypothetical protein
MLGKTGLFPSLVVPKDLSRTFVPEEDSNMKKPALLSVVAFLTFLPFAAQAQNAESHSKKPASLSGEIGSDGSTLTADRDHRIWRVSNPEVLRGIDARHVRVRAQVDAAHGQIQVLSVSAIADERSVIKLDDAAFRR